MNDTDENTVGESTGEEQPALTGPVRWSVEEGKMVPDDNPLMPEGRAVTMVRWARVVNGIVMQATVEYPDTIDPNVYYGPILSPEEVLSKFFLCPEEQVGSWWLYDENTNTYSPPPPITAPPLGGVPPTMTAEDMLVELKANPTLLSELRQLLKD